MSTAAPPRRQWTRLTAPEVALRVVALLVVDAVVAAAVLVISGDSSCTSNACRTGGVSVTRPLVGLGVAVAVVVVPLLLAWWRRRGLRTTAVVQLVVGALLVAYAANSITTAAAVRRDPPPVPFQPSLRPCAEKTLEGHICVTYSESAPVVPVASP